MHIHDDDSIGMMVETIMVKAHIGWSAPSS